MKYTIAISVATIFLLKLTAAEDPWTPSPLCPYPSENLTRAPYEGDCTKYWECYEGARYVMTCAEGLEYNAETARCDTPEEANCNPDATVIYPTYPHTQGPDVTGGVTASPDPLCPYPSEVVTYYPYPYNCSQYYECFEGAKYLMDCPANLYWNVLANYCDYLENVDCSRNNATTTPRPTTSPGETTTKLTTTTTEASNSTWAPDPLCPYPSEDTVFYPNPDNCAQYFECYEGDKYLMNCPTGLYWNALADYCDYPENVNCNASGTTTTKAPPGGSTLPSNSTSSPGALCTGQVDGTYFPNPYDCTKFYECVNGLTVDEQCPAPLYWNQQALTCDYPENVNCSV